MILDGLTLVLGLIIGLIVVVGAGMARADHLPDPLGPMPASQVYVMVIQAFGVALLVVMPSALLVWYGRSQAAVVFSVAPFLIAALFIFSVRHFFY